MTGTLLPPADLGIRDVPIAMLDTNAHPLRRIHRNAHDPIYYNKAGVSGSRFRFDAPNDEYGTLYASQWFDACVAETLVRDLFIGGTLPLQMEEACLALRSVSTLVAAKGILRLADLTEAILHLGCTAEVLATPDYTAPNLWSRALQQHPERFDGILFRSRYANQVSVAIFDHVPMLRQGAPIGLLRSIEMARYLDRFQIALI